MKKTMKNTVKHTSLGPCVIPWAFHDHFGFFAELYSLNGADSKKKIVGNFFRSHLRP
jgi:hypothetical protein